MITVLNITYWRLSKRLDWIPLASLNLGHAAAGTIHRRIIIVSVLLIFSLFGSSVQFEFFTFWFLNKNITKLLSNSTYLWTSSILLSLYTFCIGWYTSQDAHLPLISWKSDKMMFHVSVWNIYWWIINIPLWLGRGKSTEELYESRFASYLLLVGFIK